MAAFLTRPVYLIEQLRLHLQPEEHDYYYWRNSDKMFWLFWLAIDKA